MNILSYQDVEKYLQNKQVYFKKEIVNSDFKTIAESGIVHNIGKVELNRISPEIVAFTICINSIEVTMHEYKTDSEFFSWIRSNFIPVSELVNHWMS
jgi:hypothetical protein